LRPTTAFLPGVIDLWTIGPGSERLLLSGLIKGRNRIAGESTNPQVLAVAEGVIPRGAMAKRRDLGLARRVPPTRDRSPLRSSM
jgi:hypothetical protein